MHPDRVRTLFDDYDSDMFDDPRPGDLFDDPGEEIEDEPVNAALDPYVDLGGGVRVRDLDRMLADI